VVVLVQLAPTHHITHIFRKWDANIHIPDNVQKQLASRDQTTRERARSFVAIRFRNACREKFGTRAFGGNEFIEWNELKVTVIPPVAVASPAPKAAFDYSDCDECAYCDIGNHHTECMHYT